jgi:hypothetical protein
MRTAIIIAAGLIVLAACLYGGRLFGRAGPQSAVDGARVFIAVWFAVALTNLWLGVAAGYSVTEELPIFLLIFLLPAAAAAFAWWRAKKIHELT